MKKICLLLMLTVCAMPLFGGAVAEEEPLRVTASFYPLYLAAMNIVGDVEGVEVSCLAPPSAGCLHDYQMTTDDRRVLEDTDILIINGAGLESFLDKVLPTLSARVIDASEGIGLLESHGEINPHIWVSPEGMMDQVRNILEGLSDADPAHADIYEVNANAYLGELAALYAQMKLALEPYKGMPIVTFHESFDYFAEAFDLLIVATVEGDHDTAPSARDLAGLADLIRDEGVKALFAEPQYEDTSVEILSRETGVPMYLLDPVVPQDADMSDPTGYVRIMEENLKVLLEAFS